MPTPPLNSAENRAKAAATIRRGPEIDAAIIANDTSLTPRSRNELAKQLGISPITLSNHVKALRMANRIPHYRTRPEVPTPEQRSHKAKGTLPKTDLSGILDAIDHETSLTPEQRRRILDQIAIHSTDNVRVVAISKLEDLERMQGTRIGPPEPQTDDEYAARLGRMILAAGPRLTQLAVTWAANHKEDAVEAPAEGNLGPDEHGNGPTSGCGPETGPTQAEPGQETASGGGPTSVPAPQVPPSGGLSGESSLRGPETSSNRLE
jgi:hypothetical protein